MHTNPSPSFWRYEEKQMKPIQTFQWLFLLVFIYNLLGIIYLKGKVKFDDSVFRGRHNNDSLEQGKADDD